MASASSRVLSAFKTAPIMAMPKCASYRAGIFGALNRNRVARADAPFRQGRSQAPAAFVRLGPGDLPVAVYRGDTLRINRRRAREQAERRERHVVRRILIKVLFVRTRRGFFHELPQCSPSCSLPRMRGWVRAGAVMFEKRSDSI